nr:HAD-IIIC family phosphatase [uncultured Oribacterium sp.]
MKELEFPFDAEMIIRKKKAYKKALLNLGTDDFIEKKIAILAGETTEDIKLILELFLLHYGIKPSFYESEYNKYYEDGMFPNEKLEAFSPDLIYICTSVRNITTFPAIKDSSDEVLAKRSAERDKYYNLWDRLKAQYHCPIIQNNFEYPFFRLFGNKDASDEHGRVNFVTALNMDFNAYAQGHRDFYICDINYISSVYGLKKWSDPYYWHMYKYAVAVPAIPYLSFNVANIIKSIYGKNKKVLNLDLDNTLWGGVIGDDGVENIEIGQETSLSQTYSEFQNYLLLLKDLGILLTVNSKNQEETAVSGLQRPDSVLKKEDFSSIQANWNPKSENLLKTARDLGLLPESFVFVDDNPAEREVVKSAVAGVSVPEMNDPEHYIDVLDQSGFFELTSFSEDDLKRNKMMQDNAKRIALQASFLNYDDYLQSLDMKGEIRAFTPIYMSRIAQLTNKSNQFNLTTKRYSLSEIEDVAKNPNYITLYGRLQDKFGDNGVVSTVIGRIAGKNHDELHMELWLMSCRVLKREMEYAMMDTIVEKAKANKIKKIIGYYYPTAKNAMVKDFYQGFSKIREEENGDTVWEFNIPEVYKKKQNVIRVVD